MRCEEIMKRDVECIFPQDTVQAAARRMRDENLGFLPVCDRSKKVLGALTYRDLAIRVLSDGRSASTSVEDVRIRPTTRVGHSGLALAGAGAEPRACGSGARGPRA